MKIQQIGQYKVILDDNNDPIDVWDENDSFVPGDPSITETPKSQKPKENA
jgi:hypothetical protein